MSRGIPYHKVCLIEDIPLNAGVCALLDGRQIALFRAGQSEAQSKLYAVDNFDPCSDANVISRGIVGSSGEVPKVASPIYKQQFNLVTGECLDDSEKRLNCFPIREQDGVVYVSSSPK